MGQLSYGDWLCAQREAEEDRLDDEALRAEAEAEDDDLDEGSEVMA